ncbi:MAG: hypothetical protein JWP87_3805 [Labilithrix sp.]|nr:hypothetical protein [Labilithrix sp.]
MNAAPHRGRLRRFTLTMSDGQSPRAPDGTPHARGARMRGFSSSLLLLSLTSLCGACSTIKPSTTVPAPAGPYAAAENEAVVVFHRRSLDGPDTRGDDLAFSERWSYVRIYGGEGAPLADVRATEHAVVRLTPGEHAFYVKNWAAEPSATCIAALHATLERGRVYAIDIEATKRDASAGCEPLRLIPVDRASSAAFFEHLAATQSEQRSFLGTRRETSILLDNDTLVATIVRVGAEKLVVRPVTLTAGDGLPWTAASTAH